MSVIDILVYSALLMLVITSIFLYIAKKRMDRNEPVFGWKRKQYLQEMQSDGSEDNPSQNNTKEKKTTKQKRTNEESIMELMEIKKIERSVVEREKNERLVILSTDFVNFHLLRPSERVGILEGYAKLFSAINFSIQIEAQAVRQDFSKERYRFEKNLSNCNEHAAAYNRDVINHIQSVTENDFRITLRIYYIVKYVYEPSKLASLTKEQREIHILDNIGARAELVRRTLGRAKVKARVLNSLEAAEVYKRALNRERMVINPIETIVEEGKLAQYVTMDLSTLPGFEKLVKNLEEVSDIVKPTEKEEETEITNG